MAIDAQPAGTTQPDPGPCTPHRVEVGSLNSVFVRPLADEACTGADPCPHRDLRPKQGQLPSSRQAAMRRFDYIIF